MNKVEELHEYLKVIASEKSFLSSVRAALNANNEEE